MGIYCPQTATTYADLGAFHSAVAGSNFGALTVGEVSGATVGGYVATSAVQYPDGLEIRAALGEEFNGVFGLGAALTGLSFEARHSSFTTFTGIELLNATTTEDIVTQQLWEGVTVTVDSCGISGGRIGIAPKHSNSVFSVNNTVVRNTYKSGVGPTSGTPAIVVQNSTAFNNNGEHGVYAGGISRASIGPGSVLKNSASFASYYTDFYRPNDAAGQSNLTQTNNASGDATAGQDYSGAQQPSFNALINQDYTAIFENALAGDFRQKASSPLLGAGELGADIGAFAPQVGGGSTIEAAASFSISSLASAVRSAVLNCSVGFSVDSSVSQAGNASIAAICDYVLQQSASVSASANYSAAVTASVALGLDVGFGAFIETVIGLGIDSQLQSQVIASLVASVTQSVSSNISASVNGILAADAVLSCGNDVLSVSGATIDVVAAMLAGFAVSGDADISIECVADFSCSSALVAQVVADLTGEASFNQVVGALASCSAVLLAQSQFAMGPVVTVSSGLQLNADCQLQISSVLDAVGGLSATVEFVLPATGRLVKVIASNRSVKVLSANRVVKVL